MSYITCRDDFLIHAQTKNVTELVDNYISAEFIVKGNDVGSAVIVMPGQIPLRDPPNASQAGDRLLRKMTGVIRTPTPGVRASYTPRVRLKRVVPNLAGQLLATVWSGDIARIDETWDSTNGPTTTLTYECDNRYLQNSVIKPDPGRPAPPYPQVADVYPPKGFRQGQGPGLENVDAGGMVMLHYMWQNNRDGLGVINPIAGDWIPPPDWIGLGGLDPVSIGDPISGIGRWQTMLTFMAELADACGMMFQIVDKLFQIIPATTKRQPCFDIDGSIRSFTRFDAGPKAPGSGNYFYLGGAGTGSDRTIYELDNEPPNAANDPWWGRVEQWIDRSDITDVAARDTAFATAKAQSTSTGLAVEVLETGANRKNVYGGGPIRYGAGYGLNCLANVRYGPNPEQVYTDVVRGCRFTFGADGTVVVAPKIGRDSPIAPQLFGTVDLLGTQIREVQRG